MIQNITLLAALILGQMLLGNSIAEAQDPTDIKVFTTKYCVDCHQGAEAENGFDISKLGYDLKKLEFQAKWEHIYDRVASGEMPPKDAVQPGKAKLDAFTAALARDLTTAHKTQAQTVYRRLNRVEYEYTLNDLLKTNYRLAELLPEDGNALGFDNIGEGLDISVIQLQRYMDAGQYLIDRSTILRAKSETISETHSYMKAKDASRALGKQWGKLDEETVIFFGKETFPNKALSTFKASVDGRYEIQIKTKCIRSEEPILYSVTLGPQFSRGGNVRTHDYYEASLGDAKTHTIVVDLEKNDTIKINPVFLKTPRSAYKEGTKGYEGPGLAVYPVKITGPIHTQWPTYAHQVLYGDAKIEEIEPANPKLKLKKYYKPSYRLVWKNEKQELDNRLVSFATLLYRRPVTIDEITSIKKITQAEYAKTGQVEKALEAGYLALMCSPRFLYLQENEGALDDYALASRLSYFLWSSAPDKELLKQAKAGKLSHPSTLVVQLHRMLKDQKSMRFVENFTGQWLKLRDIEFTNPDNDLYPEFDRVLQKAMLDETHLFFNHILQQNLSTTNFLDSDWTFLNKRLADHYGVPDVHGQQMRLVSLQPDHNRGGLLTQASIHKVTANGTVTSPVTRGAFVLDRILGAPPPPPPPGVPGVEPDIRGAVTLRDQLAKHRELESCNNCHAKIDPPGFALECYDVIGGYRTRYRSKGTQFPRLKGNLPYTDFIRFRIGPEVDASGKTESGDTFSGMAEYKKILLSQKEAFAKNLIERLLSYASGRRLGFSDRTEVNRILQAAKDKKYRMKDMLELVVQSHIFTHK